MAEKREFDNPFDDQIAGQLLDDAGKDAFTTHEIPWNNCVSFGVDNTSVNMGCRNSIKSRVLDMNPAIYIVGCPCHVVHNTALKVANAFEETSRFNVEDTVINIYYWFDKSTKRKASLTEFYSFCAVDCRKSVKTCKYQMEKKQRFRRLHSIFEDPMMEVYLLFYQSALQPFIHFNMFLQRENPIIPTVHAGANNDVFTEACQQISYCCKLLNRQMETSVLLTLRKQLPLQLQSPQEMDKIKLSEEFVEFQLLREDDIPKQILEKGTVKVDTIDETGYHRMDVSQPWRGLLKENIEKYLQRLENGLKETDPNNYSVYTGSSGIALLYYHLSSTTFCQNTSEQQQLLSKALDVLESNLDKVKGKRLTFLCGDAGVYALSAVLYSKHGDMKKCEKCVEKLCAMCESVVSDPSLPDEILYGRAGYLYSLLFIQTHLGKEKVSDAIIEQVVTAILKSGLSLSRKERSRSALMYVWHDKHYVGAAHGIVGILYMLLQVYPSSPVVTQHITEIQNTIDYLLTKQFSSGNFPSSLENESDRLIHWCHGAPGAVFLMLKAYQVFEERRYLDVAISCGNVVWKRGLLRKGYGICHGVSGNAYTFLALYKQTGDQVYLHRALKFAEWTFSYGEHNCRTPDTPYSLFEGLAGTIYFWSDLFEPQKSRFPAFEM